MEEKDVIDLYCQVKNLDIKIWIDGGWGVDALLGQQTRFHKDFRHNDSTKRGTSLPEAIGRTGIMR